MPTTVAIAAGEDAQNAAELSSVGPWRSELDQDLVALHGVADFVGRDKNVVFATALARGGQSRSHRGGDQGVRRRDFRAVAGMRSDVSRIDDQTVDRIWRRLRDGPLLAIGLEEMAGGGKAGEMFEEKAAFAASAEREFADELLVSSALTRGSLDVAEQFAVGHSDYGSGWREHAGQAKSARRTESGFS